jgi:site-specific DNA-cytosine methylase
LNVLSLFDGMSCGQLALQRSEIHVKNYYASEVDKHAISVALRNFPDTIQLGDVRRVNGEVLPKVDLLIGGSPCQGFSFAGKMTNFDDPRSQLFFEYVRLLEEISPKYFLLENVIMAKKSSDVISNSLGVGPVEINSNLFSAQNRRRLYWTNIPIPRLPASCDATVSTIKEPIVDQRYYLSDRALRTLSRYHNGKKPTGKSPTITGELAHGWGYNISPAMVAEIGEQRRATPVECERLQTLPDNYTAGESDTQRYKMIANGWTVEVISHIFLGIKEDK